MKLFTTSNNSLQSVPVQSFELEKEIQDLVENNVSELFNLKFVKSEMSIQGFRLDTLCFDETSSSFVIIEYKRGKSYSVIDQGYTYLSILLNNKADFVLEYNESTDQHIKRDEVDWTQSRVIFVSPKFSTYQKNSVNFKNLPFELWEITRYQNDTIGMNRISTDSQADINATLKSKDSVMNQVSKEVIRYDEDYHLNKSKNRPEFVKEMYFELKERILDLADDVEMNVGKQTIGFKQNRIFTDLILYNKGIGVVLNVKKGELNDPLNKTEDLSDKGHWGNGDYRIWLKDRKDLEYTMSLVEEAFGKQ